MMFRLGEVRLEPVMKVGDIVSALENIGSMPEKVADILKRCLQVKPTARGVDPSLFFGHAVFEDGREFWTLTGFGKSKKGALVRRTSIYSRDGVQIYSGGQNARGSLHTMEGRRETKLIKSVMST